MSNTSKKTNCISLFEKIFTIASFIFYSDAILLLLSRENVWVESLSKIGYYLFPTITLLLIIYNWRKVGKLIFKEKLIWIFVAFTLLSVLWSVLPVRTLRMEYSVIRTTLFGIYFASRYTLKEQFKLILLFLGIITLLNFIFVLILPKYGIMGYSNIDLNNSEDQIHIGAWQGVFTHKNALGRMASISGIFFLISQTSGKTYLIKWLGIIASVALIIFSRSSSSLVIFAAIIALIPLFKMIRWSYIKSVPLGISIIIIFTILGVFGSDNSTLLFSLLGKDATLTGRTEIWDVAIWSILQKPLQGYGFGAFWVWGSGVEVVWKVLGFQASHSHNGLLDLLLNLGIVGTTMFTICYLKVLIMSIKFLRLTNSAEGLYPVIYITFVFLTNLTESQIISMNHYWIIFISIIFMLHRNDNFEQYLVSKKSNLI